MPDPTEALREMLDRHPAAPFLFVGSGFSRRYLGLEDWSSLLKRFCEPIRDFGYYFSRADRDLPSTASYMADDYNEWWWSDEDNAERRDDFGHLMSGKSDTLKFDIASYVEKFSLENARSSDNGSELSSFANIAVDGIITTNWDHLIDDLFPDYKVFVGQSELIFSNPQAIGEIYKIHGTASDPTSLVLTSEDYQEFSEKNPYLAAKLVTIFVEHPIIFIGYSIADPHIRDIIMSIAKCLPQEKIASFQENLIFVQRTHGSQTPNIEKTTIQSGLFSVTMMVMKVANFSQVYDALNNAKRKIPARVLRFFKEQLYELVHSSEESDKKIAVVDYDDIESGEEIEFVIGVGVAKGRQNLDRMAEEKAEERLAAKGYAGVSIKEIFADVLENESNFDGKILIESAFPGYARSARKPPVFRYLRQAGITSNEELEASNYEGAKKIVKSNRQSNTCYASYRSRYEKSFSGLTTLEIIEKSASPSEAVLMIGFQEDSQIDLVIFHDFLKENFGKIETQPYASQYYKMIRRYDQIVFGF